MGLLSFLLFFGFVLFLSHVAKGEGVVVVCLFGGIVCVCVCC